MHLQIQFTIGPPGPEQWIFYINKQPLFRLELFSIQRPLLTCYAYGQAVCSNQQPVNAAPSRALCLKVCSLSCSFLVVDVIKVNSHCIHPGFGKYLQPALSRASQQCSHSCCPAACCGQAHIVTDVMPAGVKGEDCCAHHPYHQLHRCTHDAPDLCTPLFPDWVSPSMLPAAHTDLSCTVVT